MTRKDLPLDVSPIPDGELEPGADPTQGFGLRARAAAAPTGTVAALAGLLVAADSLLGLGLGITQDISYMLIGLVCLILSAVAGRWAADRGLLWRHPAGGTAIAATLLVWAADHLGAQIPETEAILLVSGLTAVIGLATPRSKLVTDSQLLPDRE